MTRTWNSNFSYAQLYTKLYVGDLTKAQGRIAVKVLQLQGERLAYTKRPTNVAMIEKQQNAWNSVEPIINKMRELQKKRSWYLMGLRYQPPPGVVVMQSCEYCGQTYYIIYEGCDDIKINAKKSYQRIITTE